MNANDVKFTVERDSNGSMSLVLMAEVRGRKGICSEGGGLIISGNGIRYVPIRKSIMDYPIDSDLDAVQVDLTEYFTKAKECWIIDYNARIAKDKDNTDFLAKVAELKIEV